MPLTKLDGRPEMKNAMTHHRQLLVDTLRSPEFLTVIEQTAKDKKSEVAVEFHDTLMYAKQQGFIHYTQLAERVGLSHSQANRWFERAGAASGSTPSKPVRLVIIEKLAEILEEDIRRINRGEEPLGPQAVKKPKDDA